MAATNLADIPYSHGESGRRQWFRRRVPRPSALRPLARSLARRLRPGSTVLLEGELGSGKTAFVRALCRELGVAPSEVRSPSFTLVNEYQGRSRIYHMDFFRLGDALELETLGLDEMLGGDGICFIEWPGIAGELLSRLAVAPVVVRIEFTGKGDERLFTVSGP